MSYFSGKVIEVSQPFGAFYIASIPASKLIKICYSFAATFGEDTLNGIQRGINDKRVDSISRYCQTQSPLFPTSIILSANLLHDGGTPEKDAWYIDNDSNLIIPTSAELASIVDGQHRIAGLKKAIESGDLKYDFDLVCSIYFELPAPKQAEVFATINFNQQKVDKSLAYQLFGYDLESEENKYWAPDTLAIYLARLLDQENDSPLHNRIDFGMKKFMETKENGIARENETEINHRDWTVSTSTIVEGISSLISSNPTKDRYFLHKKRLIKKDRSILLEITSKAPLREHYISNEDRQIYDLVLQYFSYCDDKFWNDQSTTILRRTIGIQALFDFLRFALGKIEPKSDRLRFDRVRPYLEKINKDKISELSANFSGMGRLQIRNCLMEQI